MIHDGSLRRAFFTGNLSMNLNKRRNDTIDEKAKRHFNHKRQGHNALVSREQMYEMRYRAEFEGWYDRKIAEYYKLDLRYVRLNVLGGRTMAGVVPVRGQPSLLR